MAARFEVNCSILFTELPLLERPQAAKDAGFDAVEFWWPFAGRRAPDAEVDAFVTAVRDAGVQLVGLNFFAGDMPGGDRGLVVLAGARSRVPRQHRRGRRHRRAAGLPRPSTPCTATARDGVRPSEQDELGAENLRLAADTAGRIGGTVLRGAGLRRRPLPAADRGRRLAVIDRVRPGADNVKLLATSTTWPSTATTSTAAIDAPRRPIRPRPDRRRPGPRRARHRRTSRSTTTWTRTSRPRATTAGSAWSTSRAPAPTPFGWLPREQRSGTA